MGGGGVKCARCRTAVDRLEIFPGGVCIECWAASPEGRYVPTVEEFTASWGVKVFQ